jgi:hypothetical protein
MKTEDEMEQEKPVTRKYTAMWTQSSPNNIKTNTRRPKQNKVDNKTGKPDHYFEHKKFQNINSTILSASLLT